MFKKVGEFHDKFELPRLEKPGLLSTEIMDFRLKFMQEELNEMKEGYEEGDLEMVADALVDLVYVVLGTAHFMGLPFEELFTEVHKANMTKIRAKVPSDSKRGTSLDIVKPVGWKTPDLLKILYRK